MTGRLYFYATMSYLSRRLVQLSITALQHEYNNLCNSQARETFSDHLSSRGNSLPSVAQFGENARLLELMEKTRGKKQFKIQWHEQGVPLRASLLKVALSLLPLFSLSLSL